MNHISQSALRWAVQSLSTWAASRNRNRKSLARLLVLKAKSVPYTGGEVRLTSPDFSSICARFLQVSFESDPTLSKTHGEPRYFDPFTPGFKLTASSRSDWAIGTLWTRRDIWEKADLLNVRPSGDDLLFSFPPDYVSRFAKYIGAPIPLLPTAIFMLRRPSDSKVKISSVSDSKSLVERFRATFNFDESEIASLFADDGPPPNPLFAKSELSRDQVLDEILPVVPFSDELEATRHGTEAVAAAPAPVTTTVDVDELPAEAGLVGLDDSIASAWAALDSGQHVILIGPPGTGKTTVARAVATRAKGEGNYLIHTATADWSTFETIGGYMPSKTGELQFAPGLILQAIQEDKWLIIDELNRADIDKAFGELFTLLTAGKVLLAYGRTPGSERIRLLRAGAGTPTGSDILMQSTWRMIGTMNSMDKASLHQLSYAFMRRFTFVHIDVPELDAYRAILLNEIEQQKKECNLKTGSGSFAFIERTREIYLATFASAEGLASKELKLGAGIPLAMLRYTRRRCGNFATDPLVKPEQVFVEACSGMLLPQFEGRRALHGKLVKALTCWATVQEADRIRGELEHRFATWTGDIE